MSRPPNAYRLGNRLRKATERLEQFLPILEMVDEKTGSNTALLRMAIRSEIEGNRVALAEEMAHPVQPASEQVQ